MTNGLEETEQQTRAYWHNATPAARDLARKIERPTYESQIHNQFTEAQTKRGTGT